MNARKFLLIIMILPMAIFVVAAQFGTAYLHDFTGLPMTADGWTDLNAIVQNPYLYNDSRIVYVSTSGNDGTGATYTKNSVEIRDDPFNPSGTIAPFATLAVAFARLRNGYPDIMLLKRGDDWNETLNHRFVSGRSINERMIVGAYGPATSLRPKIDAIIMSRITIPPQSNHIISSIEFKGGFVKFDPGSDILVEDCAILKGPGGGMTIQGISGIITNMALRRCVIAERYPTGESHCQGMFVEYTKNFLLEECILDHNGWTDNIAEGNPGTVFNHNTYFSTHNEDTVFRYNWSSRSSSHGYMSGGGGITYANLSFQDPIGINPARLGPVPKTWKILSNVLLESMDFKPHSQTNWGIYISNTISGLVQDNIIAGNTNPVNCVGITGTGSAPYGGDDQPFQNVTIDNNIIHNWRGNSAIRISGAYETAQNITISNNKIFEQDVLNLINITPDIAPQIISSGNTLFSGANNYMGYNGTYMSLPTWKEIIADTTSIEGQTTPSSAYTIESYLASVGLVTDINEFYVRLHEQRKGNWDTRYTALPVINFVRSAFGRAAIPYNFSETFDSQIKIFNSLDNFGLNRKPSGLRVIHPLIVK